MSGEDYCVLAVIGDGAMGGGMAFEALNHAGDSRTDLIVVLNDNEMSISHNVGGLAAYLERIRTDPKYTRLKADLEEIIKRIPAIGDRVVKSLERLKDAVKTLIVPGMLFEELGFTYLGPVNGHNLGRLQGILRRAKKLKGPVLVHVLTTKGKGFAFAENNPDFYHGVAPFDPRNPPVPASSHQNDTYTGVFARSLVKFAEKNEKILAITAAMSAGTGLDFFAR